MLVERAREVAVEELVVVDGLCDDVSDKLEVIQVLGVDVGQGVGHVRHAVAGRGLEEGVVGVEHLPRNDDVPLSEETPSVLALLPVKRYVQVGLPLL